MLGELRRSLVVADFTVAGVTELIGAHAHEALARNETTPARQRTSDGSPLATLTRLWLLQADVDESDLVRALPGLVDPLAASGLLERAGGQVRARLDVRPYADDDRDWWVVSDLTPGLDGVVGRMAADHVLGVSTASTSLAQLTMRTPVQRALDLGTGSGVQLLHLSSHVADVVGTDVNPRCLDLAKLTLDLNEVAADVRAGDLFEPVAGERFDLIVSNPPFVISPGDSERLAYRDSGLPGDEVVRRLVSAGADHLSDGGWLQALGNWVHLVGEPWSERVGRWVSATGCDAWVIEREVVDPPRYVEMWLADAGLQGAPDYVRRYDAWLRWFDEQHVEAVGFGWLNLHRTGRTEPVVRLEEWPYAVDQPIGSHIAAWGRDVEAATAYGSSAHDVTDTLLRQRLVRRSDVREERTGVPGDAEPQRIVLRQRRGLRRARSVSTVEAAFYGACDGDLTVGQIAEAVAMLLGTDVTKTTREVVAAARDLIATGYFTHEKDPAD